MTCKVLPRVTKSLPRVLSHVCVVCPRQNERVGAFNELPWTVPDSSHVQDTTIKCCSSNLA